MSTNPCTRWDERTRSWINCSNSTPSNQPLAPLSRIPSRGGGVSPFPPNTCCTVACPVLACFTCSFLQDFANDIANITIPPITSISPKPLAPDLTVIFPLLTDYSVTGGAFQNNYIYINGQVNNLVTPLTCNSPLAMSELIYVLNETQSHQDGKIIIAILDFPPTCTPPGLVFDYTIDVVGPVWVTTLSNPTVYNYGPANWFPGNLPPGLCSAGVGSTACVPMITYPYPIISDGGSGRPGGWVRIHIDTGGAQLPCCTSDPLLFTTGPNTSDWSIHGPVAIDFGGVSTSAPVNTVPANTNAYYDIWFEQPLFWVGTTSIDIQIGSNACGFVNFPITFTSTTSCYINFQGSVWDNVNNAWDLGTYDSTTFPIVAQVFFDFVAPSNCCPGSLWQSGGLTGAPVGLGFDFNVSPQGLTGQVTTFLMDITLGGALVAGTYTFTMDIVDTTLCYTDPFITIPLVITIT